MFRRAFVPVIALTGLIPLTAADPDFDTRSYGHKKLSDLVKTLKIFETRRDGGNQLQVRRID